MILGALKSYMAGAQANALERVERYLSTELMATLREIRTAFTRLRFIDNFEGFTTQLVIPANSNLAIPNELRGTIPTQYLILRKNQGGLYVCDGDTEWTTSTLYLKNTHATLSATITVVFLK